MKNAPDFQVAAPTPKIPGRKARPREPICGPRGPINFIAIDSTFGRFASPYSNQLPSSSSSSAAANPTGTAIAVATMPAVM
jgi:hypothetical protein